VTSFSCAVSCGGVFDCIADGDDEMGLERRAGTRDRVLYERRTLEIGTRPDPHDEGAIPRPRESGDVVCLRCINGFIEYVRVWGDGATTFDANDSPGTLLREVLPFALLRSGTRLMLVPLLFG
jgi:hypothetical protein